MQLTIKLILKRNRQSIWTPTKPYKHTGLLNPIRRDNSIPGSSEVAKSFRVGRIALLKEQTIDCLHCDTIGWAYNNTKRASQFWYIPIHFLWCYEITPHQIVSVSGHMKQHKNDAEGHVKWSAKKGKGVQYWHYKHKGKKHHHHHYWKH